MNGIALAGKSRRVLSIPRKGDAPVVVLGRRSSFASSWKAFYGNLPPRNYRFRVAASNNGGVWHEARSSYDFSSASLAAVFVAILWELYRLRLCQLAREFSAQTGERARIARDLHAARNILPRRPEEAIDEGWRAIQDLRATAAPQSDLEYLLTAAAQEPAQAPVSNGTHPVFGVTVEGSRRILSPALQDEVYRIGREVLPNAFRHAHAGSRRWKGP